MTLTITGGVGPEWFHGNGLLWSKQDMGVKKRGVEDCLDQHQQVSPKMIRWAGRREAETLTPKERGFKEPGGKRTQYPARQAG